MNIDLQAIRQQCHLVAKSARDVHIDDQALRDIATTLPPGKYGEPSWDAADHYTGSQGNMAQYVLQLSAINFGISSHSAFRPYGELSPYVSVARRMTDHFERHGPWSADELTQATAASCAKFFGQDRADSSVDTLMQSFATAWNELGTFIKSRHQGSFDHLFSSTKDSSESLIDQLLTMPMYQDVASYDGRQIQFFTRAQMCVSDLKIIGEGHSPFNYEVGHLTAFANETVPHMLHTRGALKYSARLQQTIASGKPLQAGSQEEVEIRACCIAAIERLSDYTGASGAPMSPRSIDSLLWHEAEKLDRKQFPSHWCKTTAY